MIRERRTHSFALFASVLLTACDKPETGTAAVSWTVTGPRVTISSAVPEGHELNGVVSARRLGDGRIVVANSGTNALLVFDSGGTFMRAVGRKGQGPGEFAGSLHLFRAAADSLAVYDGGNLRWTFYDQDLNLGRTAPAAESGIPRQAWLYGGAVVTNSSLGDGTGWPSLVIDRLRAGDPEFASLLEARVDDQGAVWVGGDGRWLVHAPALASTGEVTLPGGRRVVQAGADFVLVLARDSDGADFVELFGLTRPVPGPEEPIVSAIERVPATDSALVASLGGLLMKQEMYYADHGAYAPHADSLPGAFGDGVKGFILWGDARHWAAVAVRSATGATCAVSVGWPAPPGWVDGTPFCGRE